MRRTHAALFMSSLRIRTDDDNAQDTEAFLLQDEQEQINIERTGVWAGERLYKCHFRRRFAWTGTDIQLYVYDSKTEQCRIQYQKCIYQ
jgi:hypothetical protein